MVAASALGTVPSPAIAQDHSGWYQLDVPGGRTTLRALGVNDTRPRAAVMVELIRRLHFSTTAQTDLETALRKVPSSGDDSLTLPLPLAPAVWSRVIFETTIPPSRLFAEILSDPPARLLFHGLAGLDATTRTWFAGEPELLRRLYRNTDAVKSFALFAPAIRVAAGRVDVPGAPIAEQRWSKLLGVGPTQPARFIDRLFDDRKGRTAGLYWTIAFAEAPRQEFLLRAADDRFARLVSGFAACYPANANDYPFALRSHDAALLLMEIGLTQTGEPAGPRSQRFWHGVFDADDLVPSSGATDLAGGDAIDAAWLVDRLCTTSATNRGAVFATILAGHRTFADLPVEKWPDAMIALRVRRLFPAIFMALERAGVHDAATFGLVSLHAVRLDRLNDMDRTPIALRQFQGALALILNATSAHTLSLAEAERLLASLAAVPFTDERYDGRIGDWIRSEWLPAVRRALPNPDLEVSAEDVVAQALAGPPPVSVVRSQWEGLDYVVDFPASIRERLLGVRARQGGPTLDRVLESRRHAREDSALRDVDALLAHVLASWAYAPHIGAADGGALVGGDASLRHDLGLRSVNRTRFEQRWEIGTAGGERASIAGSFLGLEAALANWSLRRLASDTIPSPPTIGGNDLRSLLLTAALSDPSRLTDESMGHVVTAIAEGTRLLDRARTDPLRLLEAGRLAGISPWRREVLPWLLAAEPDRLDEQFSLVARARLGGLRDRDAAAWGTAALATGCLCLEMPSSSIPELILGRAADGMVGGQSADLMLHIAMILTELRLPASLASPVMSYAMRDFLDAVRPEHPADFDAYSRAARALSRTAVEDYISAIAAVGALRPVSP